MVAESVFAIAVALLAFGAVSRKAEKSVVTPPMFFVGFGFLIGGGALALLDLELGGASIHFLAEIALVVVLFTDASRIDLAALRREESLPFRLLSMGMPLTIALGTLLAIWVFPALSLVEALLLAAILAPTDAALGQAVVSNPLVPVRIRQSLNVESGLNDGIALPVVLFFASLAGAGEPMGDLWYWLRFAGTALILGPVVGVAVGVLGGRVVEWSAGAGWINEPFQKLSSLGLAFLAYGGAETIGGNGFIAAFVAGLALGNSAPAICPKLHEFAEAEGQLLTLLVFTAFGAILVPRALPELNAEVLLYGVLSLSVIRMVPVSLSLLGSGVRPLTHAFLGWFGPRGLASILFVLLVVENAVHASGAGAAHAGLVLLETVVITTVLLSTLLHGLTAYPLARRYGERVRSRHPAAPEHHDAMELPPRLRH